MVSFSKCVNDSWIILHIYIHIFCIKFIKPVQFIDLIIVQNVLLLVLAIFIFYNFIKVVYKCKKMTDVLVRIIVKEMLWLDISIASYKMYYCIKVYSGLPDWAIYFLLYKSVVYL